MQGVAAIPSSRWSVLAYGTQFSSETLLNAQQPKLKIYWFPSHYTVFLEGRDRFVYYMLSVQSMFKIYLILTINLFLYYVHEYLSAFMNVQHLGVWCLRGPEEDLVFSETVINHACEPPCKRYTCIHALCKSSKCS